MGIFSKQRTVVSWRFDVTTDEMTHRVQQYQLFNYVRNQMLNNQYLSAAISRIYRPHPPTIRQPTNNVRIQSKESENLEVKMNLNEHWKVEENKKSGMKCDTNFLDMT